MFLRGDIWRALAINRLQAPTLLSLRDSRPAYTAIWDFFPFIGRLSIAFFLPFAQRWLKVKKQRFLFLERVFIWGPFSICQTKQSATSRIIKGKMECTVGLKQSFQWNQSDLFAFQPKSWLPRSKVHVGLETRIFWKWNGKFWLDWTNWSKRTTSTGKFLHKSKHSIYFSTEIS